ADDLDGDFAGVEGDGDEALDFGRGLRHKSSDEEDSGDEEEESESETDEGEDIEGDELSGEEEDSSTEIGRQSGRKRKADAEAAGGATKVAKGDTPRGDDSLPFTFEMPSDYEQWVALVGNYSLEQQLVVIQRLRTLYHHKLAPQNKVKLADLFSVLLEHLA
ncbi:nucleolar complex protein 14, partial [Spiromyces aspiralis]